MRKGDTAKIGLVHVAHVHTNARAHHSHKYDNNLLNKQTEKAKMLFKRCVVGAAEMAQGLKH